MYWEWSDNLDEVFYWVTWDIWEGMGGLESMIWMNRYLKWWIVYDRCIWIGK